MDILNACAVSRVGVLHTLGYGSLTHVCVIFSEHTPLAQSAVYCNSHCVSPLQVLLLQYLTKMYCMQMFVRIT